MGDGPKPSDQAEDDQAKQDPNDLMENTKLWLGKDYSNFIRKDWVQLDKPFEGVSSKSSSVPLSDKNTEQKAKCNQVLNKFCTSSRYNCQSLSKFSAFIFCYFLHLLGYNWK